MNKVIIEVFTDHPEDNAVVFDPPLNLSSSLRVSQSAMCTLLEENFYLLTKAIEEKKDK